MKWLFNLILVVAPILSSYSILEGLDLGTMSIALFVPIIYILHPVSFKWPKYYLFFLLYLLFDSFLIDNVPIRVLLYSFILFGGCMYLDKNYFLKIYDWTVVLCGVFFIVQFVFQLFLGRNIPGIFSFLPTVYGDERDVIELQMEAQRLSSFFLEPSYFAQYLFPHLCINLFANKTTKSIYKVFFSSAILILLRSGVGLIMLTIVWSIWFLVSREISKKVKLRIITLISIPIIILIFKTDVIEYAINRSSELSISDNVNEKFKSSGFQRLFNGYFVFDNLNSFNKLYGINPEELRDSVFYSGSFLNGISTILIMEGWLGLIFFFPHLMRLYFRDFIVTKAMIICIVFLLFSEAYFPTCRMQFAMIIAYAFSHQRQKYKTNIIA